MLTQRGWPSCYRIKFCFLCVHTTNLRSLFNHAIIEHSSQNWVIKAKKKYLKHYSRWGKRLVIWPTEKERETRREEQAVKLQTVFNVFAHLTAKSLKWFMQNDSRCDDDDENSRRWWKTLAIQQIIKALWIINDAALDVNCNFKAVNHVKCC